MSLARLAAAAARRAACSRILTSPTATLAATTTTRHGAIVRPTLHSSARFFSVPPPPPNLTESEAALYNLIVEDQAKRAAEARELLEMSDGLKTTLAETNQALSNSSTAAKRQVQQSASLTVILVGGMMSVGLLALFLIMKIQERKAAMIPETPEAPNTKTPEAPKTKIPEAPKTKIPEAPKTKTPEEQ